MGTKSKQRRRRERAARYAGDHAQRWRRRDDEGRRPVTAQQVCDALWSVTGVRCSDEPSRDFALLMEADVDLLAVVAESQIEWLVAHLWTRGWQPAEVARYAQRTRDAAIGRIITVAIAADHERRDPATLHPQWAAQLEALGVESPGLGWLADELWALVPDTMPVLKLIDVMELCVKAGDLPTLIPPPGADPTTWDRQHDAASMDDPVLAKVRALLAQAESTTFDAEAEAFTAKAQELMARHAIDSALVWSRSERKSRPITIRLPIDDPYADQKSLLLHFVAEHSQCTAVLHPDCGLQSVIGFAADVAAAETLFTSLLVQSQAAMRAEASSALPGSRVRSRSFRASFQEAYAHQIDRRLTEINRSVRETAEAENDAAGTSILPVLAARRDAIDAEVHELFGKLGKHRSRGVSDDLGWARGALAADRAELNQSVVSSTAPELFGC